MKRRKPKVNKVLIKEVALELKTRIARPSMDLYAMSERARNAYGALAPSLDAVQSARTVGCVEPLAGAT